MTRMAFDRTHKKWELFLLDFGVILRSNLVHQLKNDQITTLNNPLPRFCRRPGKEKYSTLSKNSAKVYENFDDPEKQTFF